MENQVETPNLLLVDDDQTFCMVLAQALKKRNFNVAVAYDIASGLALAEEETPEYAVIDLRIGHESGLELVKKLIEIDDNTRIVMLTGFASIATAVEAIKLGATQYLTKPAHADEIINALHKNDGDSSTVINDNPLSVKRLEWQYFGCRPRLKHAPENLTTKTRQATGSQINGRCFKLSQPFFNTRFASSQSASSSSNSQSVTARPEVSTCCST